MDELENLGLDQYLMNTTALSPLSAAAQTPPAVQSTYIPYSPYGSLNPADDEAIYRQNLESEQRLQQIQQAWAARPYSQAFGDRVDYSQYDPSTADYMRGLESYVRQYGLSDEPLMNRAPGAEDLSLAQRSRFNLLPEYQYRDPGMVYTGVPGLIIPGGVGLPAAQYAQVIAPAVQAKTPYEQMVEYQFAIPVNYGLNSADPHSYPTVSVRYDTPIQLVNNATGETVYSGTGFAAAQKVAEEAAKLSRTGGGADWGIYTAAPGSDKWTLAASDTPNRSDFSVMGDFAVQALPMIGAMLMPPIGALGAAASAGLGAAAGSTLGGVLQGKDIGDILKNAAISGLATYAGGELFKNLGGSQPPGGTTVPPGIEGMADFMPFETITSAMTPAQISNAILGGATAAPIAGGIGGALGDVVVAGSKLGSVAPGIAAGVGSVAGGLASLPSSPSVEQQFDQIMGEQPIKVLAAKTPTAPGSVAGVVGGTTPNIVDGIDLNTGEIVTTAPKTPKPAEQPPLAVVPPPNIVDGIDLNTGEIVTTAPKTPKPTEEPPLAVVPPGSPPNTLTPDQIAKEVAKDTSTTDSGKSTLDKIIDYLQLAGLGTGLLGNLLGSDGSSPAAFYRGAGTPVSPIFGATLPAANLPGGAQSLAARPGSALAQQGLGTTQDWYRYGYGPEQSFFANVPQGARNTSTAYTGYAKGGDVEPKKRGSFAVRGPGTGRSDDIPALLSDGEYVIDAETVALLGDGSNKAGAKRLDDFRVNVRKHKGRKLARGKFSVNAKKPEAYMAGGRT